MMQCQTTPSLSQRTCSGTTWGPWSACDPFFDACYCVAGGATCVQSTCAVARDAALTTTASGQTVTLSGSFMQSTGVLTAYRDATLLRTINGCGTAWGTPVQTPCSYSISDTPPPGSYTYSITVNWPADPTAGLSASSVTRTSTPITITCPAAPCTSGQSQCFNATATQSCTSASGCLAWSDPVGCDNNQVCSGGTCIQNQCTPGQTKPCYDGLTGTNGTGACRNGLQTCTSQGVWGSTCVGEVTPATETCNGIDDNCNGQIDEGLNNSNTRSYCVHTTSGWQQVTQSFSIAFSQNLPQNFTANKNYEYGLGFEGLSSVA